nr:hypothetical protein [Clostridium sp. Marseille-P7770]
MSKYKVGDRVVVISKEKSKDLIGQGMFYIEPFCGKTVTIKEVDDDETYRIEGSDSWWSEEFFEGLEKDIYTKPARFVFGPATFDSMHSDAFASLAKASLYGKDYLKKLDDAISLLKDEKENTTMDKKDILAVRNYKDRAMVMQFDKKDKNGKNVQTRAEVHDGDTFDLDNGIRICLLKYLLGGHKEYMAIMDAARKSYKKTVKEDQKKAAEKYKKVIAPDKEANKKKEEKERRDKEIEELIAKAIKKALAETGKNENKSVEE